MFVGGTTSYEPGGRAHAGAYDTTASIFRPSEFAIMTTLSPGSQLYSPRPCISSVDQLNAMRTHVAPNSLADVKSSRNCASDMPMASPLNDTPTLRPSASTAPARALVPEKNAGTIVNTGT